MASNLMYVICMGMVRVWKIFHRMIMNCNRVRVRRHLEEGVFEKAGITVNGHKPWDIQIHDDRFFARMGTDRTLGMGESYMEGWWDCADLAEFFRRMVATESYNFRAFPWVRLCHYIQFDLFNLQTSVKSMEVIQQHYDMGNTMFESFLDPYMNYTCGYWRNANNLHDAQIQKMHLIAKKLKLEPGMRVLDIGCGWGGLCQFLAEHYQVSVVGVTISEEGAAAARKRCGGLPVQIRIADYRQLNEKFDRIVVVGMMEHVGHRNYKKFFSIVNKCLNEHGLFLLQTIGNDNDTVPRIEAWMNSYIFPNGSLPRPDDITKRVNRVFTIEDWHNFGTDYSKTLVAWHANFCQNWPTIRDLYKGNDDKAAFRMWTYYFLSSAGCFQSRKFHLWQIVFSKNGLPGGYESVR